MPRAPMPCGSWNRRGRAPGGIGKRSKVGAVATCSLMSHDAKGLDYGYRYH